MGCIYMYTNKINDMKYIGQTSCKLQKRHHEHLYRDNSYIDKALRKYGEDNFIIEVLEDNIPKDLLDEKEEFYIQKYGTYTNGYNLTKGGLGAKCFDDEDAEKIKEMLRYTDLTMEEIGKKTGYSLYSVSSINVGDTAYSSDENYPIRPCRTTQKFFQKDADAVINLLKNSELTFKEIAEATNVNFYYVTDINKGNVKCIDYHGAHFPIRDTKYFKLKMTLELAKDIVKYLKQDIYSADQIGEILGIPGFTVGQINRGKSAICKELDEQFPIRSRVHRNREAAQSTCAKLSKEQVEQIAGMILNTDLSFEEIAKRFGVTKTTINRINKIEVWKNILTEYRAPIRTNPYNKKFQS